MEILTKKLRELNAIQPNAEFRDRSRALAARTPQFKKTMWMHIRESMSYSIALGLGALLLLVGLGQFSYLHLNGLAPTIIGSLQTKTLVAEEVQTDFALQIAEATYFNETAAVVASALSIVRDTNPDHTNDAVLERELKELEHADPKATQRL